MDLQSAKDSIKRYVEHGVPTGGFLQSVLANDLMEAMGRADMTSRLNLFEICSYVYNEVPIACHGSYEKVEAWLKMKRAALNQMEAEEEE